MCLFIHEHSLVLSGPGSPQAQKLYIILSISVATNNLVLATVCQSIYGIPSNLRDPTILRVTIEHTGLKYYYRNS